MQPADDPSLTQKTPVLPEAHAAVEMTPGLRFPGYEILDELGRGGMGVVYRARQLNLKRLVALKVVATGVHASPDERARFRTEAEAVARLQHPNIVRIHEVGAADGVPYLSLELITGFRLDQLVKRQPLPARQAAQVLEALARAMHYAHQQGIVHRDLKPSNVLFDTTVEPGVPKITDFGLAKVLNAEPTRARTEALLGTPQYMAPEQARGDAAAIGPLTDVYALGAILYELLTGRPPFRATTAMKVLDQVRREEPEPPTRLRPQVPHDLETVCLKCLEKEPAQRYASALDLAEDLRRFLAHEPIRARPAAAWERVWKWARRRPAAACLAGVTCLAIVLLLGLNVRHQAELQATEQQARTAARLEQAGQLRQSRERLQQFRNRRDEALFHGVRDILFPAADAPTNPETVRQAVRAALAVVDLDADAGGVPALDPHWTDAEKAEVAAGCCQLLLFQADAVGQPAPGQSAEHHRRQAQQALRTLDRAARLVPPTRAYHLRRARFLLQSGDAPAAEEERQRATAVRPASMIDHFLIGTERYQQGGVLEACQHFQQALLVQPNDFWSQYLLAACQLKLARPAEAEVGLTKCLSRRPDFLWAHLLRGLAREQRNAFEAAESDFRAALALGGDAEARYVVHVTRGLLRFRRRQLPEAAADLEQAIALKPGRFNAYVSLARVYQAQQRWDESSARFEQAGRLQPPREVAAECQAERSRNCYLAGRYPEALDAAAEALRQWPEYAEGHQRRALALLALRRYPEAVAAFDQCLAAGGKAGADLYRGRGRARMALGDPLGARDDYTRALELEPDPHLLAHRGWAYFFADAWKPALRDFDDALRQDPATPDARIGRGLARVMLGDFRAAVGDAEEALRQPPTAPEMMHNIACIFALAAARVDNQFGEKDRQLLGAQYRAQALETIRRTLALVPAAERARFWRTSILPDPALDAVRQQPAFRALEQEHVAKAPGGR
jgi:tetratricopeptide (TPR) repeat protein